MSRHLEGDLGTMLNRNGRASTRDRSFCGGAVTGIGLKPGGARRGCVGFAHDISSGWRTRGQGSRDTFRVRNMTIGPRARTTARHRSRPAVFGDAATGRRGSEKQGMRAVSPNPTCRSTRCRSRATVAGGRDVALHIFCLARAAAQSCRLVG